MQKWEKVLTIPQNCVQNSPRSRSSLVSQKDSSTADPGSNPAGTLMPQPVWNSNFTGAPTYKRLKWALVRVRSGYKVRSVLVLWSKVMRNTKEYKKREWNLILHTKDFKNLILKSPKINFFKKPLSTIKERFLPPWKEIKLSLTEITVEKRNNFSNCWTY